MQNDEICVNTSAFCVDSVDVKFNSTLTPLIRSHSTLTQCVENELSQCSMCKPGAAAQILLINDVFGMFSQNFLLVWFDKNDNKDLLRSGLKGSEVEVPHHHGGN
jgi:hypothetical protein